MKSPDGSLLQTFARGVNCVLGHTGIQIITREPPRGSNAVEVPVGGFRLRMPASNPISTVFERIPTYSGELVRLAACVSRHHADGYVIDVGANVGDTAALIRSVCALPIVCVEGDEATFKWLGENIRQLPHVTAHCFFLSERTEVLNARIEKAGWNSTLVPTADENTGSGVRVITLDEAAQNFEPGRACKLLKVDAEGFDLRILRGAPALLDRDRPVILFEFNAQNLAELSEDGRDIFGYLVSRGYQDLVFYDANGRMLLHTRSSESQLINDLHDYVLSQRTVDYYDICAFHADDAALAAEFIAGERRNRLATSKLSTRNPPSTSP